jgi:hypothetical protein
MTLEWVKGHDGILGNEESNCLTKQGANKLIADELDLEILIEFNLQGAKLATLTQATAYRGIMEKKNTTPRNSATRNLQLTRDAIQHITGDLESDATIWLSIRKSVLRPTVQQFLYKSIHNAYKVGRYWSNIPGYEDRGICSNCDETESLEHILTECRSNTTQEVWNIA